MMASHMETGVSSAAFAFAVTDEIMSTAWLRAADAVEVER